MDAAARCLERNDPALAARFLPGIIEDTGKHLTVRDVPHREGRRFRRRRHESVATRAGDGTWRLSGEKVVRELRRTAT